MNAGILVLEITTMKSRKWEELSTEQERAKFRLEESRAKEEALLIRKAERNKELGIQQEPTDMQEAGAIHIEKDKKEKAEAEERKNKKESDEKKALHIETQIRKNPKRVEQTLISEINSAIRKLKNKSLTRSHFDDFERELPSLREKAKLMGEQLDEYFSYEGEAHLQNMGGAKRILDTAVQQERLLVAQLTHLRQKLVETAPDSRQQHAQEAYFQRGTASIQPVEEIVKKMAEVQKKREQVFSAMDADSGKLRQLKQKSTDLESKRKEAEKTLAGAVELLHLAESGGLKVSKKDQEGIVKKAKDSLPSLEKNVLSIKKEIESHNKEKSEVTNKQELRQAEIQGFEKTLKELGDAVRDSDHTLQRIKETKERLEAERVQLMAQAEKVGAQQKAEQKKINDANIEIRQAEQEVEKIRSEADAGKEKRTEILQALENELPQARKRLEERETKERLDSIKQYIDFLYPSNPPEVVANQLKQIEDGQLNKVIGLAEGDHLDSPKKLQKYLDLFKPENKEKFDALLKRTEITPLDATTKLDELKELIKKTEFGVKGMGVFGGTKIKLEDGKTKVVPDHVALQYKAITEIGKYDAVAAYQKCMLIGRQH